LNVTLLGRDQHDPTSSLAFSLAQSPSLVGPIGRCIVDLGEASRDDGNPYFITQCVVDKRADNDVRLGSHQVGHVLGRLGDLE